MEQKIPVVTIHSQAMAGYLMMKRFILIDTREDLKNPEHNVFIFKDSKEIRNAMQQYTNDKGEINKILFAYSNI
jgi:hypothetical protein